jgi:hypothetical protein
MLSFSPSFIHALKGRGTILLATATSTIFFFFLAFFSYISAHKMFFAPTSLRMGTTAIAAPTN